jgi:hypothetical protein
MLELANTFHRSLDRLMNTEQAAAKTVVFDYMADPSRPGLSLHRVDKARDKGFWTIRVNRDLRIVVFKQNERSVFCYVGHHDDAYSWAAVQGCCKRRSKKQRPPLTGSKSQYQLPLLPHSQPELLVLVKPSGLLRSGAIQTEADPEPWRSVVVRSHERKLQQPQVRFERSRSSQRTL